jgi:hypothetical protein
MLRIRYSDKKTCCVATFISNKQKSHAFLFMFYLFSSTKSENKRVEQVMPFRGGTSGRGGGIGERG